jgi:glycosyltransferase involved in cell wall biosynthesis
MTKKILVVSNDLIPEEGLPTSGGGLRAWGICCGLRSCGFDVVCSIPESTYLSVHYWDQVPRVLKRRAWNWSNQPNVIEAAKPDIVIFSSNPGHIVLPEKLKVPTVLDVHGPFMLEHHFLRRKSDPSDWDACSQRLAMGDFFIAAGHKQKRFLWSWLYAAGVDVTQCELAVIPVSLSPDLPEIRRPIPAEPTFVFGGGFFPWTDPSRALMTLVAKLEEQRKGHLWVYTDNHKLATCEDRFQEVSRRLLNSDRVSFPGLRPRDEMLQTYAAADVAVDLMNWNVERELAVTTRTVEYLWCGLPVIYNNYAELATFIKQYNAGWCVDPEDSGAIETVLDFIMSHPEVLPEYGHNAQRLVREHFTWDKTISPLARYCANPTRRAAPGRSEAQIDIDLGSNEFLTPRIQGDWTLSQVFLARYPGLARVDLLLATYGGVQNGEVTFRLVHPRSGLVVRVLTVEARNLLDNRWFRIDLEPMIGNSAGELFELQITSSSNNVDQAISLWATSYDRFPMAGLQWGPLPQQGSLCLRTYYRKSLQGGRILPTPPPTVSTRLRRRFRKASRYCIAAARAVLPEPVRRILYGILCHLRR